jgi:hypothetical protein
VSRREDEAWETGWDGHEAQQLRRLASLTLAAKLEWLEEAQRLLRHLSAARRDSAEVKELARREHVGSVDEAK